MKNMRKGRPKTAIILKKKPSHKNKLQKSSGDVEVESIDSIDQGIERATSEAAGKRSKSRPVTAKTRAPKEKGFYKRFPDQPIRGYVFFSKQEKRKPPVTREIFDQEGKQFVYLDTP